MTGYPGVLPPPNALQRLRSRLAGERGFSLIELLVVILIIGILAAIALPTFLGQRDKAYDSVAKSQLGNASSAASFHLADQGSFSGLTDSVLYAIEPTLQSPPQVTVEGTPTATAYTIRVTSDSGTVFRSLYVDGVTSHTCDGSPCSW